MGKGKDFPFQILANSNYVFGKFHFSFWQIPFQEGRKEMFYLTTHSTHFIYVIWRQAYGKGPLR